MCTMISLLGGYVLRARNSGLDIPISKSGLWATHPLMQPFEGFVHRVCILLCKRYPISAIKIS